HPLDPSEHLWSLPLHDPGRDWVPPEMGEHRTEQAVVAQRRLRAQQIGMACKVSLENAQKGFERTFDQGHGGRCDAKRTKKGRHSRHDLYGRVGPGRRSESVQEKRLLICQIRPSVMHGVPRHAEASVELDDMRKKLLFQPWRLGGQPYSVRLKVSEDVDAVLHHLAI